MEKKADRPKTKTIRPLSLNRKPVFTGKLILGLVLSAAATSIFLLVYAPVLFLSEGTRLLNNVNRWFCLLEYHEEKHPAPIDWANYQMAILDRDSHPPLESVPGDFIAIAYVSVGEAEDYRPYWDRIKDESWIIEKNQDWKGSHRVDVRSAEWQDLLEEIIIEAKSKGFRGIFLDTLDVAVELERKWPDEYAGSKEALIGLVRRIRWQNPDLIVLSNNGYDLLPRLAPHLNGIVAEGLNSRIDFKGGGFKEADPVKREAKIAVLKRVSRKHSLPVFVLDYAPEDGGQIRRFRALSREEGFRPYVAGRKLDRIYPQ